MADYRAALRAPGAAGPMLASVFGRFPIAMLGLASLFYVQRAYGSFGPAGFVAAATLVGEAVGSVVQGRIIDRHGPTRPLLIVCGVFAATAGGLTLAIEARLAVPVLVAAGLAVGLSMPALPGASRALWTVLVPAGSRREAAFTYEAVSMEVFFILGPAVAAGLIAAPWAGTGFAVATGSLLVGNVGFALTRTVRGRRPAGADGGTGWGALASPGMRVVVLAGMGFGWVAGSVEVGVPAVTTRAGWPALSGLLLSAWSIASVLSGLLYALRPWPRPLHLRMPALLAGFGLGAVAMAFVPGLVGLGVVMLIAGCLITPQVTGHSLGVELTAPAGTATEAFGWVVTAITLGLACGQALGGALIDAYGPSAAFLAGGLAGVGLAAAMWFMRRALASGGYGYSPSRR
ncbi:MFS transporter [Pseudonocardia acaciae]|uniref:MFS transporter n=1 Tax=Pseudonocardia acaciae TaxID=551276 RepID=UPI000AD9D6CC|nr:MFS transporter [Pseudonocardia acaciae]